MKKPKTITEVQLVETSLSGRVKRYGSKDLAKALKDVEWYKDDILGRTAVVQTREVTMTPWVTVNESEPEPKFAVHIGAGVFHVWDHGDTLCRMWSTGGLNHRNYRFTDDPPKSKEMCTMCSNNQGGD